MAFGPRLALTAALIGFAATPTAAEWSTAGGTLLHPDAAALTGTIDAATSLTVSCADQTLSLALTTRATNVQPPGAGGEGTLRIVPDAGNWSWLNVTYRQSDGAVVAETSAGDLRAVVDQIVGAKATITYLLDFVGGSGEVRWTGDAVKSTAAGRAFLYICFERATDVPIAVAPTPADSLVPVAPAPATTTTAPTQFGQAAPAQPEPTAPAQPDPGAPAPSAKTPAWVITLEPDPENGGERAILTGDLGHFDPGWFFAYCDGLHRPGLSLISDDGASFPFAEGDRLLQIGVGIDAEPAIEGYASYYIHDDRFFGVRLNDPASVKAIMAAVANTAEDVAVTISRLTDFETRRWSARNLDGLADAVGRFNAHCFATPLPAAAGDPTQFGSPQ